MEKKKRLPQKTVLAPEQRQLANAEFRLRRLEKMVPMVLGKLSELHVLKAADKLSENGNTFKVASTCTIDGKHYRCEGDFSIMLIPDDEVKKMKQDALDGKPRESTAELLARLNAQGPTGIPREKPIQK